MSINRHHNRLPELLAPAGSPEALEAAFLAGADAVYLGGSRFNARLNAHNFDPVQLREAVTHAHRMGGRVYLTLNTLLWDRELPDALSAACEAAEAGVDALIIADVGAAALIRRALPGLPLHASTQLSGHNAAMGGVLAPFGFSRFVIARETSFPDLAAAVQSNPLEVEVFIHGALCVSHSGQCLFSSVVGGRSGNRGECAQPCRLPYGCADCRAAGGGQASRHDAPTKGNKYDRRADRRGDRRGNRNEDRRPERESYPLSLKDLSLAAHVPALIEAGVSSLKIEGRMKSPGYVAGVTAIWRRLLDENRAATPEELTALGDLFSRGGFTDGYQVEKINRSMMGVRSEADKERTASAEKAALTAKHSPHLPMTMRFTAHAGEPVTLTAEAPLYRQGGVDSFMGEQTPASTATITVTATGDIPAVAETEATALTAESVEKQLSRTGGTPYCVVDLHTHIQPVPDACGLMLPLSRLNALRREVLERLDTARMEAMPSSAVGYRPTSPREVSAALTAGISPSATPPRHADGTPLRTARFYAPAQITPAAMDHFDLLYLPLGQTHPAAVPMEKRGAILPPVIFDREAKVVADELAAALSDGIRHLLVGNLGHLPLIHQAAEACGIRPDGLYVHGDFRLNITNTPAAARLLCLGVCDLLLSPELTLPRMRDIGSSLADTGHPTATGAIMYGRLPLMLLEKCAIREVYRHMESAAVCREICANNAAVMRDRMGKDFPILREASPNGQGHRNTVYNSLPLGMSDRMDELLQTRLGQHHFIFSVESPAEVDRIITAYRECRPLGTDVRRMLK